MSKLMMFVIGIIDAQNCSMKLPAPTIQTISRRIFFVRGQRVMLDNDLAELYGVLTKNLNKAVRRNFKRFPSGFMLQLTAKECENVRFQIGTSSYTSHGGRRYLPLAFTEYGVVMLSSVLNSDRAIQVNIAVIKTFVRLRKILNKHKDLAKKLEQLEKKYDRQFSTVFHSIKKLMETEPIPERKRISGLRPD